MSRRGRAWLTVLALAIAAGAAWLLDATGAPGTLLVATGAAVAVAAGLLVRTFVSPPGEPHSASAPTRRDDALAREAERLISELAFAADRRRAYDASIRPALQRLAGLRWSRAHPGSPGPPAEKAIAWLGPTGWDLLDPDRPPAGPEERGVPRRAILRLLTALTQQDASPGTSYPLGPPVPPGPAGAPRPVAPGRAGRRFRRTR